MRLLKPDWISHDGKPIFSVDIHPDGSRVATGGQGESSGKVAIWNMGPVRSEELEMDENVPKLLCQMDNHLACVNCVRWSNDGRSLASAGDDKLVMIWQTSRSAGGTSVGFGSARKTVNCESWRVVNTLRGHNGDVLDLAWSLHDAWLATCSVDNTVVVWNALKFPEQLAVLRGHTGLVKGVTWDPVGKYLASQSDDKTVRIWRTFDWQLETTISEPFQQCGGTTHVLRLSWSPDGQYVVTAHAMNNSGPTAQIIERAGWRCGMDFVGHRKAITAARFNSKILTKKIRKNSEKLQHYACCAIGSRDRSLSVWITAMKRPLVVIHDLFSNSILDLTWSSAGSELICCSWDGTVAYFDFTPEEIGKPMTDKEKMDLHKKLYGKSILSSGLDTSSVIIETPAMLDIQQRKQQQQQQALLDKQQQQQKQQQQAQQHKQQDKDMECISSPTAVVKYQLAPPPPCGNSQSMPPLDRQIETRTKDGTRRITPIFLAPQPEVGDIPLPYTTSGSSQPVFTSSKETSSIIIEKKNEITSPVSSLKFKDGSRSMHDALEAGAKVTRLVENRVASTYDNNSQFCTPERPIPNSTSVQVARCDIDSRVDIVSAQVEGVVDRMKLNVDRETAAPHSAPHGAPHSAPHRPPYDFPPKKKDGRGRPRKDRGPDGVIQPPQQSQQVTPSQMQLQTPLQLQPLNIPRPVTEGFHPSGHTTLPVLPPCSIDRPLSIQIGGLTGAEPPLMLELENDVTSGQGVVVHRLRCVRGGRPAWEAFLTSRALTVAGSSVMACVACEDRSVHVFSAQSGLRQCAGMMLDGVVTQLHCAGPFLLAVTTRASVSVWNIQSMQCVIKNESLLPVFTSAQTKLELCSLTMQGQPIVSLNNGKSYTFKSELGCWVLVSSRDDLLARCSNHQSSHASSDSRLPAGPLATLQTVKHRSSSQALQLSRVPSSAQQSLTVGHLEAQLAACLALKSADEYRYWLLAYTRYLVQEGLEVRLRGMCDDLLGPVSAHGGIGAPGLRWEHTVLGHQKKSLLADILPIIGTNLQLQRVFSEYREQLASNGSSSS